MKAQPQLADELVIPLKNILQEHSKEADVNQSSSPLVYSLLNILVIKNLPSSVTEVLFEYLALYSAKLSVRQILIKKKPLQALFKRYKREMED
jgi:hypothetical protein